MNTINDRAFFFIKMARVQITCISKIQQCSDYNINMKSKSMDGKGKGFWRL